MIKNNLRVRDIGNVRYYISKQIEDTRIIKHFFSSRHGGVSSGEFESLNLGIYTSDEKSNIEENINIIFRLAEMDRSKMTYLKQIHSNRFFVVDGSNYDVIRGSEGDALITACSGIAIGVFTADCVPIILVDAVKKIIAVVHAGWKGTFLRIVQNVANYMINEMGSSEENIIAAIGPSIGGCCFEVKADVAEKFTYVEQRDNKLFVDLWSENVNQLTELGILPQNIDSGELCTMCSDNIFFSYRRDNGKTGRLACFVELI